MTLLLAPYLLPLRDALLDARRRGTTVGVEGLPVPHSDDDAYAVQQSVAEALGWFAAPGSRAWKVGASSRDAVPSAAPLPPDGVRTSPATFAAGRFNRILIEGEIAFRLRVPLDAGVAADARTVAAAVGEWLVAIEVVDPRYASIDDAGPTLQLADQGLNGGLVVGSGAPMPASVDWSALVARVRCNGEVERETRGGHPLGDLLFLLPWLAAHAAKRGMGLRAGDIVTAGTWTGVLEAFPGQTIEVEIPAIGSASARFD